MKAIRVKLRSKGDLYKVHWLVDAGRTFCGRKTEDMEVDQVYEPEMLPSLEACGSCVRTVDGWKPDAPGSRGFGAGARITAESAPGSMRKTGSLSHGTRVHRGTRIR